MLYELENAGHVYGVLMWDEFVSIATGFLYGNLENLCLMHSRPSAHVCSREANPWLDERGPGTRCYYPSAPREVQSNYSIFIEFW